MKILVTGANGFIGSFVIEEAQKRGYETYAAMRSSSDKSNLKGLTPHFIDLPYANKDKLISYLSEWKKSYGKWDYIVHTMGVTKCKNKEDFETVNYLYTKNFIEALLETEMTPQHFIYLSSLSAFGEGDSIHFTEIKPNDTPNPNTYYGKSKLKAEQFIQTLGGTLPYTILRPTGVYGPKEKDYLVMLKTLQKYLNPGIDVGIQYITFIYVKDLVDVIFKALENGAKGKAYFVADGDVWTSDEYAKLAQKLLGIKHVVTLKFPAPIVKGIAFIFDKVGGCLGTTPTLNLDKYYILTARNWKCDITPLQKDLGFKAKYNLEQGLKESIEWYKKEGWLD